MAKGQAALSFIFITILVDVIGLGIIIPVLPRLIEELTGGGLSQASQYAGWLTFAYAAMQFLCSPVLGGLSDRYGRRPVLLFSLLGLGIDYIFLALAPSIGWLFLGRLIAGVAGASFTTATAYIADISTPEKRAQNFGMVGAAFGLGFIVGPTLGGLFSHWGPRVPFIVAAGLSLLNFLYGYFVLPESLASSNRRPFEWKRANPVGSLLQLRRYPVIAGLVVTLVLVYIGAHSVQSTWTFYTMLKFKWTEDWVGYSLGFVGLLTALVQGGLIRVLLPRLGQRNAVFLGLLLYAIGLGLFAVAGQGWQMFLFLVPYCLGGITGPALQGIISSQVPANEQGELQGGLTSLISLTSIIGPLVMTNLFAYFTRPTAPVHFPGAPFVLGSLLALAGLLFSLRSLAHYRQPVHTPEASPDVLPIH
ncbi:TCR/Tet family MFS transporter [Hymenobacter guriensis]|uniref:TCR/Tet family MFS transporter n=1 Tax=Hymenobacter guriensis TaxID=2793065 RepID=A0ABS0L564_9BACT|nr:TCR/Tet family MFS transporter [Hymenobacter guriensis]MBG8555237.1 TCR/Tet family MFS transporter [Hymenobacter guriensis]